MKFEDFLKLVQPEAYDFKREMRGYYETYSENVIAKLGAAGYEELINNCPTPEGTEPGLTAWLKYRTADAAWDGRRFDCDNSEATCALARQIYQKLWDWGDDDVNQKSQPLTAFSCRNFGGDTMNSFATTLIAYLRQAHPELYSIKKIAAMGAKWERFARNSGCMGNFILVPYTFNGYRSGKTCDYWDLSLLLLRGGNASPAGEDIWCKDDYVKYINIFFLWDCVETDGTPKPLFGADRRCNPAYWRSGHYHDTREEWPEELKPASPGEYEQFLTEANRRIERRGAFMAAMLKIQHDNPGEYRVIQEWLTKQKTCVSDSMEGAVKALLEADKLGLSQEARSKLAALQKELKSTESGKPS